MSDRVDTAEAFERRKGRRRYWYEHATADEIREWIATHDAFSWDRVEKFHGEGIDEVRRELGIPYVSSPEQLQELWERNVVVHRNNPERYVRRRF